MKNIPVATISTVILIVAAFVFAALGFSQASNSEIAPEAVSAVMLVSAALFGLLAVRGLKRKEMWQRLLGVGAVMATIYMVVFAILFYVVLSQIVVYFE